MTDWWPLFGLRIVGSGIELRYADDADLLALASVAAQGIHDPAFMPFLTPWTDAPPAERARSTLQWHWKSRADLSPERWALTFVVVVDGAVVGTQDVMAQDFAGLREVLTGSWLGQQFQGAGIGTRMRRLALHFAFVGLGADFALTAAYDDNAASLAVTRKLGYAPDGVARVMRRGAPTTELRFRLSREAWEKHAAAPVEIHGLTEAAKAMLGATSSS